MDIRCAHIERTEWYMDTWAGIYVTL